MVGLVTLGTNEDGNEIFDVSSNGGSEVFGGISNHGLKRTEESEIILINDMNIDEG